MTGLILRILLFLLPVLLFTLWVAYVRNRARVEEDYDEKLEQQLKRGMLAIVLLIAATGIYVLASAKDNRDTTYVPPRTIDGEVEPGHFDAPGDKGDEDDEGT